MDGNPGVSPSNVTSSQSQSLPEIFWQLFHLNVSKAYIDSRLHFEAPYMLRPTNIDFATPPKTRQRRQQLGEQAAAAVFVLGYLAVGLLSVFEGRQRR